MSEEQVEASAVEPTVDEDQDEVLEVMTLEQRQEALKQSRWNVFMWLGIAVLMFGFALFPMSFDEEYDGFGPGAARRQPAPFSHLRAHAHTHMRIHTTTHAPTRAHALMHVRA